MKALNNIFISNSSFKDTMAIFEVFGCIQQFVVLAVDSDVSLICQNRKFYFLNHKYPHISKSHGLEVLETILM